MFGFSSIRIKIAACAILAMVHASVCLAEVTGIKATEFNVDSVEVFGISSPGNEIGIVGFGFGVTNEIQSVSIDGINEFRAESWTNSADCGRMVGVSFDRGSIRPFRYKIYSARGFAGAISSVNCGYHPISCADGWDYRSMFNLGIECQWGTEMYGLIHAGKFFEARGNMRSAQLCLDRIYELLREQIAHDRELMRNIRKF